MAKRGARQAQAEDAYQRWIRKVEPGTIAAAGSFVYTPLISIIVPAFNTPDKYLQPLLESVLAQSYTNWELCLVNASDDAERFAATQAAAGSDPRIRHIGLPKNQGIAGNTNAGIAEAAGEFIAFLDHDDTLAPFALNEVVRALQQNADLDVFYSDEDKLSDDGQHRSTPLFKPDWSPELFHTVNYLAHFVVVRAEVVCAVGGIREGYDGAQDYDFLLRVFDVTTRIYHVPHVSYHWRLAEGSTAKDPGEKTYADDVGQRALRDYVKRNKIKATVGSLGGQSTVYETCYELPKSVPVIVAGEPAALSAAVRQSLRRAFGAGVAVAFVPAGELRASAAAHPKAVVVMLHRGVHVLKPAALKTAAALALQPGVGVVGGYNLRAGVGYVVQEGAARAFLAGRRPGEWTDVGQPGWPRNLTLVNPECVAVAASVLARLDDVEPAAPGGAAPSTPSSTPPPVDPSGLCLRAHQAGLRNVVWPALAFRAAPVPPTAVGAIGRDPYLNPNLTARHASLDLLA